MNNLKTSYFSTKEMKTATSHALVSASFIYVTFRYKTHSEISQTELSHEIRIQCIHVCVFVYCRYSHFEMCV